MKKNEMTKKLMEEFNDDFIDVGGVLDTTLPDPTMVEYYRRLKKREILWNDDISDATIDIALYIKKWNAEDKGIAPEERKPIKIFINSDGGSVDTVLHIIDMIHLSKTPIYTIGMLSDAMSDLPDYAGKSTLSDVMKQVGGSKTVNNITNNSRPIEVQIGDTIIHGADQSTVDKHIKVTRDMVNQIGRLIGIGR